MRKTDDTLASLLDRSLENYSSSPALRAAGENLSYAELDRLSHSWALDLQRRGVVKGDRVAILTGNSLESGVLFVSLMRLGAVEVALNPGEPALALRRILDDVRPCLALCLEAQFERVRPGIPESVPLICTEQCPRPQDGAVDSEDRAALQPLDSEVTGSDPALIQYTSGSTGVPKGNVHSHSALAAVLLGSRYLASLRSQRLLLGIPIDHAHGKTCLIEYLVAGAEIEIQPGFLLPSQVTALLDTSEAQVIEGPPTLYEMACRDQGFRGERLPRLQSLRMNSAKPRVELLHELRTRFPASEIVVRYGLTEIAGPVSRLVWVPGKSVPLDSCGLPEPYVRVEVEADPEVEPQKEQLGEIVITSPGRSREIVAEPQPALGGPPPPYRTGDIGYLDEQGFLFLVGRKSQMIKSAGHRIFPREIEDLIAPLEGVEACAVGGVPDALLGEKIVVWVACSPGAASESILVAIATTCREHLSAPRRPHRVIFEKSLPTTPSGKIHLRELVSRALADGGAT